MIQGSDEWFEARRGNVGASSVHKVMAKGQGKTRRSYMDELLAEKLGCVIEGFTNAAMERGTELEPVARSQYEVERGAMVEEVGFVLHPTIDGFGASPDGLVGDDGLIEIKSPNTVTHLATLESGAIDGKYQWQMLAQMACTGRQWCDFMSYDDRMPDELQSVIIRFERDEQKIAQMEAEVSAFVAELNERFQAIKETRGMA